MIVSEMFFFNSIGKPTVYITSGARLSVAIGGDIDIDCVVFSTPTNFTVSWQHISNRATRTVPIRGNSRYSVGAFNNPSLTITNAQRSDEGSYQCRATNSVGQGSSGTTFLEVTGRKCFRAIPSTVTGKRNSVGMCHAWSQIWLTFLASRDECPGS